MQLNTVLPRVENVMEIFAVLVCASETYCMFLQDQIFGWLSMMLEKSSKTTGSVLLSTNHLKNYIRNFRTALLITKVSRLLILMHSTVKKTKGWPGADIKIYSKISH